MAESLRTYWISRKTVLLKYWDFYYGDNQRYYLERFEGEDESEFNSRVSGATIENHCAKTCDVLVSYLYGQPNSKNRVSVRVVDKAGDIIPSLQELLLEAWDYNDIDSLRVDVSLMASVTGVGVIYKQYVDKRSGLPFIKSASAEERVKHGAVRYEIFDTVDAMPIPLIDTDGVIYPRLLGAIVRYYNLDNFSGSSVLDRILEKRYAQEEVLEVFDGQAFARFRVVSGEEKFEQTAGEPNGYKDINVPFTLFRNYGDPMYLEGQSDLAQMITLQTTLNALLNDDKMTVDYHTFPILVLGGGAKLPPNFVRKVNSALEMDMNQTAEYLTWNNVLEASSNLQESLRRQMTVVSGVSQISRGNAASVGQVRSGAGLKTLFQADINAIAVKIPHFKRAERDLAKSTLLVLAKERDIKLPDYYKIEVDFPPDFVGIDELLKAQVEQIELSNLTRTHAEIIKAKHPEISSEDQVKKIIEANLDMLEDISDSKAKPVAIKGPETTEKKSQEQS
jgi:hypothetical protein